MQRILCATLLLAAGCASVGSTQPPASGEPILTPAVVDEAAPAAASTDIRDWIPGIFSDLWDTVDADFGGDFGFGAHLYFTNFARVGIFDYQDFGLVGIESSIFHGKYVDPRYDTRWKRESIDYCNQGPALDLRARFGVGVGGSLELRTWEVLDLVTSIVGVGYWSMDND